MNYLVAAYIFSWLIVGGYVLLLGMRVRALETDAKQALTEEGGQ